MRKEYPNGVYPVMLTPFTDDNRIDYDALEKLIDWYIDAGCTGLFATCQSSEMFFLSLEEKIALTKFVVDCAAGRAAVVASGHTQDSVEQQAEEMAKIAETGADCMVLLSNRFAAEDQGDDVWKENLEKFLALMPTDVNFGFYECPFPYRRVMTPECLQWCAEKDRFYFTKDTSCDMENISGKLAAIKNTRLKLFNANSSTILASLRAGAAGFSGVMANFHPELYVWLCANFDKEPEKAEKLTAFLAVASFIERQVYPVNAKYFQKEIGIFNSIMTRTKSPDLLNATCRMEVQELIDLTNVVKDALQLD